MACALQGHCLIALAEWRPREVPSGRLETVLFTVMLQSLPQFSQQLGLEESVLGTPLMGHQQHPSPLVLSNVPWGGGHLWLGVTVLHFSLQKLLR